jgi:hypothetical protein
MKRIRDIHHSQIAGQSTVKPSMTPSPSVAHTHNRTAVVMIRSPNDTKSPTYRRTHRDRATAVNQDVSKSMWKIHAERPVNDASRSDPHSDSASALICADRASTGSRIAAEEGRDIYPKGKPPIRTQVSVTA